MEHYSVLSKEVISRLKIKKNGIYIDCTLGLGGHTRLLAEAAPDGKIISFDQDPKAMKHTKKELVSFKNIIFVNDNFKNLKSNLDKLGIYKVDGILYDLGTSYYQLTDKERGFTYHGETTLDMRMNPVQTLSAIEVINEYSETELANILFRYGDETKSFIVAKAIVEYRERKKITLNTELNNIIKGVKGYNKNKHPSKNIFQAIRIEVNDEINTLKESLKEAVELLKEKGIIAAITFHSLEDRTIKSFFKEKREKFDSTVMGNTFHWKTSKTIYPTKEEIQENKASRSAKLRTLTKLTQT